MPPAAEDAAGITPRAAWVRASPSSQLFRIRGAYPSWASLSQCSRSHAVDSVKVQLRRISGTLSAQVVRFSGDRETGRRDLTSPTTDCGELFQALGAPNYEVGTLSLLARARRDQGDLAGALALYDETAALSRRSGVTHSLLAMRGFRSSNSL